MKLTDKITITNEDNMELTACELDSEYYEKAIERIKNHVSQQKLF